MQKSTALPPVAPSPTMNRKAKAKAAKTTTPLPSKESRLPLYPPTTTPPFRPSTPPRNAAAVQHLQLSSVRTPLSHKGLHMSPSSSLAHYKSHLDPPPPAASSFFPTSGADTSIAAGLIDSEN